MTGIESQGELFTEMQYLNQDPQGMTHIAACIEGIRCALAGMPAHPLYAKLQTAAAQRHGLQLVTHVAPLEGDKLSVTDSKTSGASMSSSELSWAALLKANVYDPLYSVMIVGLRHGPKGLWSAPRFVATAGSLRAGMSRPASGSPSRGREHALPIKVWIAVHSTREPYRHEMKARNKMYRYFATYVRHARFPSRMPEFTYVRTARWLVLRRMIGMRSCVYEFRFAEGWPIVSRSAK
jgi:hypothetical protein